MKIFTSLKAGIIRSVKSWKGILLIWLFSLLLVSLVALPMKSALNAGLGNSMIAEKLSDGINVEVLADLGATFRSLISYFSSGLVIALITGFLVNSFLSAGLFNSLKGSSGNFSTGEYFRASAKYFWSFIVISLIVSLIAILLAIIIIVIPVSVVSGDEISSEGASFKTLVFSTSFFFLTLLWVILVADYARAWQVSHDKNECFKALRFGFSQTFRHFLASYPLMLILVLVQLFYVWLVLSIIPGIKPATGGGIALLFLLSQVLFFIKILLKAWRYGSVTRLMEINIQSPAILTTASPDQMERVFLPPQD